MSDETEYMIEQAEAMAWDVAKSEMDDMAKQMDSVITRNVEFFERVQKLENALHQICRKKKLDACAAAAMQAIARGALR